MNWIACSGAVAAVLSLCACATPSTVGPTVSVADRRAEEQKQSEVVLERRHAEMRRIYDIGWRLASANVDACPAKVPWPGAVFETVNDYAKPFRAAARLVLTADERPRPVWIARDGPAARAGLRMGDALEAVNGETVKTGRAASEDAARLIRKGVRARHMVLTVERDGRPMDLVAPMVDVCDYPVEVSQDAEPNAHGTGSGIVVNRGILRLVDNDDQLALVVGHELGHNAMGHVQKKARNRVLGLLAGAVVDVAVTGVGQDGSLPVSRLAGQIAGAAYSVEFEAEADYVGMYYLARAGFSLDDVESFWRRMSVESPSAIRKGGDHPSNAARFVAIAATREEIEAKRRRGDPLTPEMKVKDPS